jgi:hypothetical protein
VEQPWECGWQPVAEPAQQSTCVATKVRNDVTYHLWKNEQGEETIQKNAQYFRVSPGAFNTIPSDETLGTGHGKEQT